MHLIIKNNSFLFISYIHERLDVSNLKNIQILKRTKTIFFAFTFTSVLKEL